MHTSQMDTQTPVLLAALLMLASMSTLAQAPQQAMDISPIVTPVDPDAIPLGDGTSVTQDGEQWERFAGGRIVRNVTAPTLTPFLPEQGKATGAAVIVAPGGGFMMLSMDAEGYEVARWLAERGVAAFVLKYRLNATPRDPKEYLSSLMKLLTNVSRGAPPSTPEAAFADAQAAVRLVRARAKSWLIDPDRVGFLGFSAGAMTTLSVGLDASGDARPNFIASIYGPLAARSIPSDAPPAFVAIAGDDTLIMRFGADFGLVTAYRNTKRPIEFHLYESGGHGFGMRKQGKSSDLWIEQFHTWMQDRGLLVVSKE